MGCDHKSFMLMWQCHQLLCRFLANDHLSQMSCQLANYKGDNEVKLGAVHRSPDIYLTAEENPIKSQLEDSLMKAVQPVISLNGVPYLQMNK